ncbi:NAD(P)-dependent oxidoreductase [Achromobacter mucicolens]|uniref:NAD(P)-dependent oxidoreductase n=1 Tax=Achromobacter mucicolens TaxID=1389922 RepID=UPI00244C891C|nr:NAD(P)-dependent oxidoreductase [Achromobacter mucicolens]MDG9970755.1 NAD(P)-dependent oxidoreductase [Achromobacter mucicolens]
MNQNASETLGFIGLGVMGGPMCANLHKRGSRRVVAYDAVQAAADEAAAQGIELAGDVAGVAGAADIVFLSLPSIDQVESVCDAILAAPRRPSLIVDMSTSNVSRTRALAERLKAEGIAFLDAPVARTKQAAVDGKLFISVGGAAPDFARVSPYLNCMGSDVLHCGEVGTGQIVKILNNYMVFMTVNALSEAITIGRQAGMEAEKLLSMLSQGSADSFVLRNHGMKSLAKDDFPEKTFPMTYAIKDCSLALDLAKEGGFSPRIGAYTHDMMCRARDAGFAQNYHPAVIQLIDGRVKAELPERV